MNEKIRCLENLRLQVRAMMQDTAGPVNWNGDFVTWHDYMEQGGLPSLNDDIR